ncbi:ATP-binding protein [Actinoplanes sp. NPDC024001]|uniref:ATP-binding protein n=1 Tax=Actinoplanes sp. NPDC024001 TaxID=3154598 RepID=UPI0033C93E07
MAVGVTADASTSVVEVKVHGRWSEDLGKQVRATLQLCLAGPATWIIIDLHDVGDLHGVSRPFWMAAVRAARFGPAPARMAFCVPARTMLSYRLRHGEGHPPLLFAAMPEAHRVIAEQSPRTHRLQARLGPQPSSVPAARDLVRQACRSWQLPQLRSEASLIVSELAANAVQHARTDLVVTASRSGSRIHLAVRDGDTRYPRLVEPAGVGEAAFLSEQGRGLQLVHAVAAAWGAMPARGGKVVWATLSPESPAT